MSMVPMVQMALQVRRDPWVTEGMRAQPDQEEHKVVQDLKVTPAAAGHKALKEIKVYRAQKVILAALDQEVTKG